MADNKDKKDLKSSIEREQSESICSAECEKIKGSKNLNVPALRFPEFTDEWKKIRLGDNCSIQMCKRIMAAQTNTEGGVPFYKIGTIGGKADAYISKDLFDEYKRKYSYPNKGEVMITCAGTVGKCVIYDGEDSYYQDSNIVWIDNPNEIISNDFLYHLLSNINWSYLNSTTIVRIYNDDLRNLKLCCPRLDEQKKIARFLSLINERIATQNKIIDKLETLIKGIIETVISSQKPNTVIKDCLECNSSILQESQVAENGSFPVYGATGISGYTETADVNGESILIIKDGSGVGTVMFVTGEYSYIGTLNRLIAKDGYHLKYIYFALQGFSFEPYKTGMAIPHIYFKDYGKAKIFCPTIEKQSAIAKSLSFIEDKVLVEKQILFCYQTQKSYLLSQMLI